MPEVKHTLMDMSLHARGSRDTARVLRIRTDRVPSARKKKAGPLESVHSALLRPINPEEMTVAMERAGETEREQMWSFVGNNGNPRWPMACH